FKDEGQVVGKGLKRMVASGLKPYDQAEIDDLVNRFNERKETFLSQIEQAA
ncbi:TPA: DUF3581 domain-containing protein, partial [Vibrio cholerae]|nr:DUF3581 domain-containing protein [Vibrio cholerae]